MQRKHVLTVLGILAVAALAFGASTATDIRWSILQGGVNTEELSLTATALKPVTDGGLSVGTASKQFLDGYYSGTVTATTVTATSVSGAVGGAVSATTLNASGATTLQDTVAATGEITATGGITNNGELVENIDTASVTSPTVTFAVNGFRVVTLNSDANQTGFYPTGGEVGQLLEIHAGSGSNTMRFDDGTSMVIGGNITLTEGQGDVMVLRHTAAEVWTRISNVDN